MVLAEINATEYGSTGGIMLQTAEVARGNGIEAYCFVPHKNTKKNIEGLVYYGNIYTRVLSQKIAKYFLCGRTMWFDTLNLIRRLNKIKPDVIHLHNLHNETVNLPMLFSYIKRKNIRVVWTLHDCWAFTGHCTYFQTVKCDKWQTGCENCPSYREYPESKLDNSKKMWRLKKKWFSGVSDLIVVTPSAWLAERVKKSFLAEYPVKVINNGIDLSVFKPTDSNFKQKYKIEDKHIVLGVALDWGVRKGLDVFAALSKNLSDNYQIVLIGTTKEIDKSLPQNIISINATQNQKELAEIYTSADVFLNPTREEVLGMVNIEALACGTPVLTFNTGGSPECIDEKSGRIIKQDIKNILEQIVNICEKKPFSQEDCINRAKKFDKNNCYKKYIELYSDEKREI